MGERRTCRERGGGGGENVQWVSHVHCHGGLIQKCLQERKRESKSTHNLVFGLKREGLPRLEQKLRRENLVKKSSVKMPR